MCGHLCNKHRRTHSRNADSAAASYSSTAVPALPPQPPATAHCICTLNLIITSPPHTPQAGWQQPPVWSTHIAAHQPSLHHEFSAPSLAGSPSALLTCRRPPPLAQPRGIAERHLHWEPACDGPPGQTPPPPSPSTALCQHSCKAVTAADFWLHLQIADYCSSTASAAAAAGKYVVCC
jgi:hypothetical protein